ncbi:MAG: hypothetical protein KDC26_02835 [Armatimonadetes bacterium]|nr:hypothetical protein [Armatimonadota bacterium]
MSKVHQSDQERALYWLALAGGLPILLLFLMVANFQTNPNICYSAFYVLLAISFVAPLVGLKLRMNSMYASYGLLMLLSSRGLMSHVGEIPAFVEVLVIASLVLNTGIGAYIIAKSVRARRTKAVK